mmetsp:Transcript_10576/g.10648  ORF Transcript_10576/g.10648 Transcript_10576/m.10648 type:complete len:136 (-) Transcript_10576:1726-2133(-)
MWNSECYDASTGKNVALQRRQFAHLQPQRSGQKIQQAAIELEIKSHITIPKNQKKKDLQYQIKCGYIAVEYSNDILKNLCDTVVQYKQLNAFRYIPLKNLFTGRENIHRKIELHAPLYLIKKVFVNNKRQNGSGF